MVVLGKLGKALTDMTTARDLGADVGNALYNIYRDFVENCTKMIEQNPNDANAYYNRGIVWLHLENWEKAESDLLAAKNLGFDIIASFHNSYGSISNYEQKISIKLPNDLVTLLTAQNA